MAPYTKFRFSVQDYYLLQDVGILNETDRVELLDGEIVPMSPIKSPHAACVDWLMEIFRKGEQINSGLVTDFSVVDVFQTS